MGSVELLPRDAVLWSNADALGNLWTAAEAFAAQPDLDERYPGDWRDPQAQLPEVFQSARRLLHFGAAVMDWAVEAG